MHLQNNQFKALFSRTSFTAILICLGVAFNALAQSPNPVQRLNISGHVVNAEIVATPVDRQRGLMFRESMPKNHGMLFVFEQEALHCFWMKNTPMPLTIGFFDHKGVLINTVDMAPFDEKSHCPTKPARYALEMNQGWFAKKRIVNGSTMTGHLKP